MTIKIQHIAYHRNGICGAPFHAILFRDPEEGNMLGVVFDDPHHVAVFNIDKLALGNVAFGVNSWRGDVYEPQLRTAIWDDCPAEEVRSLSADIHRLLASERQIAIIWEVEDVIAIRPDLTDEQAWTVLQAAEKYHDAGIGINWDVLEIHAQELFPEPKENDL